MFAKPVDVGAGVRHPSAGRQPAGPDEFRDRLVFITDREFQAEPVGQLLQPGGVPMDRRVIQVILASVPVDDDPVDPRELHQERVVFQHIGVAGVVRTDDGMVVGSDLRLPGDAPIGMERVHRPVPAPARFERRGLVPRQVMGQDQRSRVGPGGASGRGGSRDHRRREQGREPYVEAGRQDRSPDVACRIIRHQDR